MNYDLIKKNIATYEEAKRAFPIITQFENGEVNSGSLYTLGLKDFAEFGSFVKETKSKGFELVMPGMTLPILKPIIIGSTHTERFKKYISNRSKKTFDAILTDKDVFDRLLNGRWLSKPKPSSRGRRAMTHGSRSDERVEGFSNSIIPLINYYIQNNLEISKVGYQDRIFNKIRWYTEFELKLDNVPAREIDISNKLLNNLVDFLNESKIDFRKLNLEYILSSVNKEISLLMTIPAGTKIKCIKSSLSDVNGTELLTDDRYYEVISTYISGGRMLVKVTDNNKRENYYPYSNFEDMALHRDSLLDNLLG